jgi:hypothetical protein
VVLPPNSVFSIFIWLFVGLVGRYVAYIFMWCFLKSIWLFLPPNVQVSYDYGVTTCSKRETTVTSSCVIVLFIEEG